MAIGVNVEVKIHPWAVKKALESARPKSLEQAGRLGMRVARGFIVSKKTLTQHLQLVHHHTLMVVVETRGIRELSFMP
jgi:hypothetical protein